MLVTVVKCFIYFMVLYEGKVTFGIKPVLFSSNSLKASRITSSGSVPWSFSANIPLTDFQTLIQARAPLITVKNQTLKSSLRKR